VEKEAKDGREYETEAVHRVGVVDAMEHEVEAEGDVVRGQPGFFCVECESMEEVLTEAPIEHS